MYSHILKKIHTSFSRLMGLIGLIRLLCPTHSLLVLYRNLCVLLMCNECRELHGLMLGILVFENRDLIVKDVRCGGHSSMIVWGDVITTLFPVHGSSFQYRHTQGVIGVLIAGVFSRPSCDNSFQGMGVLAPAAHVGFIKSSRSVSRLVKLISSWWSGYLSRLVSCYIERYTVALHALSLGFLNLYVSIFVVCYLLIGFLSGYCAFVVLQPVISLFPL